MPCFSAADLRRLGTDLFAAAGAGAKEAELTADHLVEAGLLGHDSHSVLRYPQYVEMVRQGAVRPGAELEILRQTRLVAQTSGGWNFGPVTATAAVRLAIAKAGQGALAVVTVRDCNHVARLGGFAALAAEAGMVGVICANGHGGDLAVAPFGGAARRLSTNPLCVALPTGRSWPFVLDMTTSAISGGRLRLHRHSREPVPVDSILDAEGNPATDVERYYGPPPGAMLPLGFPQTGHKGFGLAVVVDILAGALSGAGCSGEAPARTGNALFIAVLNIAAFTPLAAFCSETQRFIDWVKSSRPAAGFAEVTLPGENSYRIRRDRERRGLPVAPGAWRQIGALAAELDVGLPTAMAE